MTREEEIIETAKFIYNPSSGIPQSLSMRVGFIEGAKWADETMIEKACKWLWSNVYKHVDDRRVSMRFEYTVDVIESFRKAMEK